jgi:endonuclease YncB( thermonuclease family)
MKGILKKLGLKNKNNNHSLLEEDNDFYETICDNEILESDNNNNSDYNFRNELLKCNNDTEMFSLEGQYKLCKVVDVYDGDTIKVVFELNGSFYRWIVRMLGYNSPEMRVSINNPARDTIKQLAIESRDFLKSIIQNDDQLVYIKCGGFDKYGRLLGTIYVNKEDKVSINQLMIDNHKGVIYDGK